MGPAALLANSLTLENDHLHQGAWAPGTSFLPQQFPVSIPLASVPGFPEGLCLGVRTHRPPGRGLQVGKRIYCVSIPCAAHIRALEGVSEPPLCTGTPKLSLCSLRMEDEGAGGQPSHLLEGTHLLHGGPGLVVPLPCPVQAAD